MEVDIAKIINMDSSRLKPQFDISQWSKVGYLVNIELTFMPNS